MAAPDRGRGCWAGAPERTASPRSSAEPGRLVAEGDGPLSSARYLDVLPLPGGCRLYYEAPLADESHELRTELVRR